MIVLLIREEHALTTINFELLLCDASKRLKQFHGNQIVFIHIEHVKTVFHFCGFCTQKNDSLYLYVNIWLKCICMCVVLSLSLRIFFILLSLFFSQSVFVFNKYFFKEDFIFSLESFEPRSAFIDFFLLSRLYWNMFFSFTSSLTHLSFFSLLQRLFAFLFLVCCCCCCYLSVFSSIAIYIKVRYVLCVSG